MNKIVYTLISFIVIAFLIFSCDKQESFNTDKHDSFNDTIIKEIDMEEMAHRHLPGFGMTRKSSWDSLNIENVYFRESDSAKVFLSIGLHQSLEKAFEYSILYLNSISLYMLLGPYQEISIGNKYWYSTTYDFLTNLVFIRKNAFIRMSSYSYKELGILAKKIDDDIVNRESYITFNN